MHTPSLADYMKCVYRADWQGVSVDRILTGNGSLQLIEFLCLHMLADGDVVFTEVPYIRVGNFNSLTARSAKLDGYVAMPWPFFWNTGLQK